MICVVLGTSPATLTFFLSGEFPSVPSHPSTTFRVMFRLNPLSTQNMLDWVFNQIGVLVV